MNQRASKIFDVRRKQIPLFSKLLQILGIYVIFLTLLVIGMLVSPDFMTFDNMLNVVRAVTLLGIVSIGVCFITYSGHYVDLSIPAIMALSGFIAVSTQSLGIIGSIICGLVCGLIVGLINGCIIGYLRLNPIIWTLAMAFMLDGLLRWAYSSSQVYPDYASGTGAVFIQLARYELAGHIPAISVIMLLLAGVGAFLMKRTRFGVHVQLTGSAYEAAKTSGVNVRKVVLLCFLLSSFTTSLAGILFASLVKLGTFDNGQGYDFNSITAVVIGGVALKGGSGSVIGALGGVLVIGLLSNILTLFGMDYFTQLIVKGLVFIIVVGATAWWTRKSGRENV